MYIINFQFNYEHLLKLLTVYMALMCLIQFLQTRKTYSPISSYSADVAGPKMPGVEQKLQATSMQ